ncbi:MAG: hypothetical protein A2359_01775 [Candidatus Moranbacteria bacterium RIFOXYB1_FULL_43_19]|nr:MAG: hypothetical protein A2359_01775 [Candidatus Moranbacteria bacterium RIFOXYB1_FULL_43_19]
MGNNMQIQSDSIGLITDKRLKIEAELVLDCLDQEILIISKDFEILFANATFLEKTGRSKEEVLGKFCYAMTHNRTSKCEPPRDPCPIEKLTQTSQTAVEVHTHLDKEGKEFLVNVVASPIVQKGKHIGYLHLAMPVKSKVLQKSDMETALKRSQYILEVIDLYQKQMTELKRKAEEIRKTKEQLENKIVELERYNTLTTGRELKMLELKKRIRELEAMPASQ